MSLVGERRAIAATVMGFFALSLLGSGLELDGHPLGRFFFAMSGVYGLAFFSLIAGYFWARWYTTGVCLFGLFVSTLALWKVGPQPQILVMGGSHLAVVLALTGESMQGLFEGQSAWRARFHMDDHGVNRLGRSVIRAAAGLPIVLIYALAPKDGQLLGIAMVALAAGGLFGLVRLRSWGVLALGGAALTAGVAVASGSLLVFPAAVALATSVAPFAGPVVRALRA